MVGRTAVVDGDGYASGDMRGAHLKLAQRHHKIVAGQFTGRRKIEHEVPHPGVVGQLALSFTPNTGLPKESRITCSFPDDGWGFPSTINAVARLPQDVVAPTLKVTYDTVSRMLELTLLNEEIPAKTPVIILVSGVTTPEKETPVAEATVTSYEKLVMRNTVPPSVRGGQILDGPSIFTISRIAPGDLVVLNQWQPFDCCPSATSDVTLSFKVHGRIPSHGKILVELPSCGWEMEDSPRVLLRTSVYHNESADACWKRERSLLEVRLGSRQIPPGTSLILTVQAVRNPSKETMNDPRASSVGKVTTTLAMEGVIDGPTTIDIARISELRAGDFILAKQAFDKECEGAGNDVHAVLHVDKLPDILRRINITLSAELYDALVVPLVPVRVNVEGSEDETQLLTPTPPNAISRPEFLSLFSQIYAPAYKYGQELRLASGRGQVEKIRELICRGCDPNAKDGAGWSSLHYAADFGKAESIEAIVEASEFTNSQATSEAPRESLDFNLQDTSGWTPLICAAANGHVDVVSKLLSLGADTSITTAEQRTALHWAATRGMYQSCEVLLTSGIGVNLVDRSGWTALHCAHIHGHEDCVQLLLNNGADPNASDKLQYSPSAYRILQPVS